MCGIVGVYSYNNQIESHNNFIDHSLLDMARRGPDSSETWTNNQNYITGFNRLAIRDLSANANQPMVSDCNDYVLSFNGEIYNSERFKTKSELSGVKFKTTSDTEVLLYGLIHLGLDYVLNQFDGIFAFAFYDRVKDTLILARDRAGVKPLYYGFSDEGVVFSSQYNHVIKHIFTKNNSIVPESIGAYLQFGYMIEGTGIISNTSFLPHGNYLKISKSAFKLKSYWEFPTEISEKTEQPLSEVIYNSTENQLVGDVPIGSFMSGGNDSTLITNFANLSCPGIKSYNIGVDNKEFDESVASMDFASKFKTDHHRKFITEDDMLNLVDINFKAFSEPFSDFSSIPTLFLSEFAKKDVTVVLSGDGGDELFWGYPRNNSIASKLDWITSSKVNILRRLIFEKLFNLDRKVTRKELLYNNFNEYYYHSLFISGAAYWVPKLIDIKPQTSAFYIKEDNEAEALNIMRKLEFDLHLQRILLKVDRASMYHSLEVRVPLLSNKVIDKSTEYLFEDCVKNNLGKIPLKNILSKYADIDLVNRKKQGFVIPIDQWTRTILKKDIHEKLMNIDGELSMVLNKKKITQMLDQHFSGKYSWGWMIWSLYSLVMWFNIHRSK